MWMETKCIEFIYIKPIHTNKVKYENKFALIKSYIELAQRLRESSALFLLHMFGFWTELQPNKFQSIP